MIVYFLVMNSKRCSITHITMKQLVGLQSLKDQCSPERVASSLSDLWGGEAVLTEIYWTP